MEKIFEQIKYNPLFHGVSYEGFNSMLKCVNGRISQYKKGEIVWLSGEAASSIGLLVSGCVQIFREDISGNQNLITEISPNEVFGETFACAGISNIPVTVICKEDSSILFLDYQKVIVSCNSACEFHAVLIRNMLSLIAKKNLLLNQKIEILSKRTTRERLLMYFQIKHGGKKSFSLSLSRQDLASYLCVERSAMSAELSRMKSEGIISLDKNQIKINEVKV